MVLGLVSLMKFLTGARRCWCVIFVVSRFQQVDFFRIAKLQNLEAWEFGFLQGLVLLIRIPTAFAEKRLPCNRI